MRLFLAIRIDAAPPDGVVLDWNSHTDDAVRPNGARISNPTQRWRARRRRYPTKNLDQKISLALHSEFNAPAIAKPKEVILETANATASRSDTVYPIADGYVLHSADRK